MTPDIRQTVEDIFQTVCELQPSDRAAYLDRACSGDEALRREVEELLRFHETHETFLEEPAMQDAARQMAARLKISENRKRATGKGEWTLGPYRVLDQIGRGGMGVVYLAVDTRDEKRVAIKVLPVDFVSDEERLARFKREGRMLEELKSLKHPNIAEIYEQAEYDGKPCIVLEYVPGDTLAERLRKGSLPVSQALRIGLQIADALESAHRQRIVHRDLKPANIKITPEGQVKILDFGLAKRFQADLESEETDGLRTRSFSLTESGMLIGTPAYMSPEQWNGQQIDQRTDLWAFGCVLYEMLTGRAPFAGKTRAETMKIALEANPSWQTLPAGTPLVIQGLLLRCFQLDTNQRLQSAKEAEEAITEAIAGNRFALPLYFKTLIEKIHGRMKSWFGRFSRKAWAAFAAAALILVTALTALVVKYTSLGDFLVRGRGSVFYDKTDLAVILSEKIKGMTPDLVRAALMPNRQSSDDLLQSDQWKALMNKPENRQSVEEAIAGLESRIEKYGETPQLCATLAQAYLFKFYLTEDVKDKNDAVRAVQKAQNLKAETPETLIAQGNVLTALEMHREAIEALEAARKQLPNDPEILLGLAVAHDLNGDEANLAEGLYKAAVEARNRSGREGFWLDYDDLGWYYFERGAYEQAAHTWRDIIKVNQFSPVGYVNLGNAFLYLGCFNEAVRNYKEAINSSGGPAEAHINLGVAYFYLGNYKESISHLEHVTGNVEAGKSTDLIGAWGNLGNSYLQNGQIHEARNAFNTALDMSNKHLMTYYGDYWVMSLKAEFIAKLNSLGDTVEYDNPINIVEKTLDPKFNCLECLATAVVVYHFAKRDDKALQMAQRVVDEGYSPIMLVKNPELASLSKRPGFRRIQQIAQSNTGNCESK